MYQIPFNRTSLTGNELDNISQALAMDHVSGDGPFSKKCESLLEQALGVHK